MIHELFDASGSVPTISCPFPEALAVIEGNNPGWVFADDLRNPRSLLVCGEEIVSLCFSGFVARDVHVIDIETEVSHRRKGYAKIVAQAFLLACMQRHLQLHWDCMAKNIASVRLAEKLGLTKSYAYTLYSFPL